MIGRIYRLMDTKRIETIRREIRFASDDIIVRPDFLSICAADQRYYFGQRNREILNKKLPMALIHEATATVMYDGGGKIPRGSKVVLIPLIENENENDSTIKPNYNPSNQFVSSNADGFMRDLIAIPCSRVIPVESGYSVIYVFSELISVVLNALETFEKVRIRNTDTIGIWGDGNMGFLVSLVIRCLYPDSKIYVFGKSFRKLQYFSFANKVYIIDRIPQELRLDHCFECVGGKNSGAAIEQMIKLIYPQGCISLLGVSEDPVLIRTRTVLDKGLILIGNSRSSGEDMRKAVKLISENSTFRKYLTILISEIVSVREETDMMHAFEQSSLNDFKTVMKWEV